MTQPIGESPTSTLPLARHIVRAPREIGFVQSPESERHVSAIQTGSLITDASESHVMVLAPTGAGKARNVLIPWLLHYRGGAVVPDLKGEAAYVTAAMRLRMGQRVLIWDPFCRFHSPNPLLDACVGSLNPMQMMLEGSTDLGDDCETLIEDAAGPAPQSSQDPFWRSNALHLGTGIAGWVWVRARITGVSRPDDQTLGGVFNMITADDLAYELAVILDTYGTHPEFPAFIRASFANFLQHEAEKVRTSVRSELVAQLRVFASERVQAATATTTLPVDFLNDDENPCTIYLVIPPDKLHSHAPLLRIALSTLFSAVSRRRTRPRVATLFLIDELGHLGPIQQLKQSVTLLRGYGVRVALFLQSIAQLKSLWPQDYESILENCGTWLNFGNTSMAAAKKVAEHLGDITAEALFAMTGDQLALHRAGQSTLVAGRLDYLKDPAFEGQFDPNPFYQHTAVVR
jgi:type IV secretion system protein VirD4